MAFERTKKLLNALIRLDETKIINAILSDKNFQKFIISLNQNDQLFEEGIDSLGVSLGEYSDFTKVKKKSDGQRFDHITLLDTGKFYKSFTITVSNGGFVMNADPVKDDSNLFDDFGKEIVGLTQENLQIVIDAIREKILTKIREQIKLVA
jgi:hypothetical protein